MNVTKPLGCTRKHRKHSKNINPSSTRAIYESALLRGPATPCESHTTMCSESVWLSSDASVDDFTYGCKKRWHPACARELKHSFEGDWTQICLLSKLYLVHRNSRSGSWVILAITRLYLTTSFILICIL